MFVHVRFGSKATFQFVSPMSAPPSRADIRALRTPEWRPPPTAPGSPILAAFEIPVVFAQVQHDRPCLNESGRTHVCSQEHCTAGGSKVTAFRQVSKGRRADRTANGIRLQCIRRRDSRACCQSARIVVRNRRIFSVRARILVPLSPRAKTHHPGLEDIQPVPRACRPDFGFAFRWPLENPFICTALPSQEGSI